MQRTVNLLVSTSEKVVTNIPKACQDATLKSLKTRYVLYSSYDENNEHTGFNIELCSIDCKKGVAHFETYKDGYCATHFTMNVDDDPIVVFYDYEPDTEYHIFSKLVDYEINQEIKQGRLYKFQKAFTHELFLAVVQSVGLHVITFNKLDVVRYKNINPTMYDLKQKEKLFSILTSDLATVEKYKNYVVTELCDLSDMFDDEDKEEDK